MKTSARLWKAYGTFRMVDDTHIKLGTCVWSSLKLKRDEASPYLKLYSLCGMYGVPRKTLLVLESEPKAAPFDSRLGLDSRRQCSQEEALKKKQLD